MNEKINRENMDLGGIYRIEFLDDLIRIYSSAVIDEKSFYTPIEGKKTFEPEIIQQEEPDTELRNEKKRKMLEKSGKSPEPGENRWICRKTAWRKTGNVSFGVTVRYYG